MTYRIFQLLDGTKHLAADAPFDTAEEAREYIAQAGFEVTFADETYDHDWNDIMTLATLSPNGTVIGFVIEEQPEIGRHCFDSTGDAYNETQCRETIKTGDVLIVVEDEEDGDERRHERATVVGLAWAWPIAVTKDHGALHTLDDKPDSLAVIMADAKFTDEQVRQAVFEARWLGAEIHPAFAAYCDQPRTSVSSEARI